MQGELWQGKQPPILGKLFPRVTVLKDLEEDDTCYTRRRGVIQIGAALFHVEAIEVYTNDDGEQEPVSDDDLEQYWDLCALLGGEGARETIELDDGGEYVLFIHPFFAK